MIAAVKATLYLLLGIALWTVFNLMFMVPGSMNGERIILIASILGVALLAAALNGFLSVRRNKQILTLKNWLQTPPMTIFEVAFTAVAIILIIWFAPRV